MYSDLAKKRRNPNATSVVKSSTRSAVKTQNLAGRGSRGLKYFLWIGGILVVIASLCTVALIATSSSDSSADENEHTSEALSVADREDTASEREEKKAEEKRVVVTNRGEYGPRIKGLRLGMKYADVDAVLQKLVDELNSDNPKYPLHLDYGEENSILLRSIKKDTGSFCQFNFVDGKLALFSMAGEALQLAFGVDPNNISDDQLLQMFMDNYGVPRVKTQTFTSTYPGRSQFGPGGGVELLGFYDGSNSEGYAFEFRGYRGTGSWRGNQNWRFSVYRYLGLDFELPEQISASDVKSYQYGFGTVIKGFQLGMTRTEVLETVRKIWNNAQPVEKGDKITYPNGGVIPDLSFTFRNGKVCDFYISGNLFRWLFRANPQYQSFKDFAQQAVDYYHIPTAQGKTKSTSSQMATCYTSTMNGIEFWIEESRKANWANWFMGCRHIDTSKFD